MRNYMNIGKIAVILGIWVTMSSGCNRNIDKQHLARSVQFDLRSGGVTVLDTKSREFLPLDDVQQMIFLSANGKREVGSLIADASRAYRGPLGPAEIEARIRDDIAQMIAAGWLRLSSSPVDLPHELIRAISER